MRRLAVAGRAVQEQAAPELIAGPEQLHRLGSTETSANALFELAAADDFGADRLGVDRDDVVVQRHRRRADVAAPLGTAARARSAPMSVSA